MKKIVIPFLLVFALIYSGQAQSPINNYDLNNTMIHVNPAFAGLKGVANTSIFINQKVEHDYIGPFSEQLYVLDSRLPIFKDSKLFSPSVSMMYRNRETGINMDEFGLNINNQFNMGRAGLISLGLQYNYTDIDVNKDVSLTPGDWIDEDYSLVFNNGNDFPKKAHSYSIGMRHSFFNDKLYYGISYDNRNAQGLASNKTLNNAWNVNMGGEIALGKHFNLVPTFFIRMDKDWDKWVGSAGVNIFSLSTKLYFKKHGYVGYFRSVSSRDNLPGVMVGGRFGGKGKLGFIDIGLMYWSEYSKWTNKPYRRFAISLNYFFLSKNEREDVRLY